MSTHYKSSEFSAALDEHLLTTMRRRGFREVPVTNTLRWQHYLLSFDGQRKADMSDTGRAFFYNFPWEEGKAPRPSNQKHRAAKVLVARGICPTKGKEYAVSQLREVLIDEERQRWSIFHPAAPQPQSWLKRIWARCFTQTEPTRAWKPTQTFLREVDHFVGACESTGLTSVRCYHVSHIETFWFAFYGHEQFLDVTPDEWDIPHLILTKGEMRNDPEIGGETLNVLDQLLTVGRETGIPVMLL